MIRLLAVDLVGSALSDQIDWFIDWVVDHRVVVVALSATIVLVGIWWQRRQGTSPLDELHSLEEGVEDTAAHDAGPDAEG